MEGSRCTLGEIQTYKSLEHSRPIPTRPRLARNPLNCPLAYMVCRANNTYISDTYSPLRLSTSSVFRGRISYSIEYVYHTFIYCRIHDSLDFTTDGADGFRYDLATHCCYEPNGTIYTPFDQAQSSNTWAQCVPTPNENSRPPAWPCATNLLF